MAKDTRSNNKTDTGETEQEAEEADPSASNGSSEAGVDKPSGTTELDDKMQFEVSLLTLAALREIAADIGKRVAKKIELANKTKTLVVIAEETLAAQIGAWRLFDEHLNVLAEAVKELPKGRPPAGKAPKADDGALKTLSLGGVIAAANTAAEGLVKLLSFFRVDTKYYGRDVELDRAAVFAAFAGPLLKIDTVEVIAGARAAMWPSAGSPSVERLKKLLELRDEIAALLPESGGGSGEEPEADNRAKKPGRRKQASEPAGEPAEIQAEPPAMTRIGRLFEDVNALLEAIKPTKDEPSKLSDMMTAGDLADRVDKALANKEQSVFLLTAKVLKAGGHYMTRHHLLSTFFGDHLSETGGAALAYSLTDLRDGKLMLSDVLFRSYLSGASSALLEERFSNLLPEVKDWGITPLKLE